MITFETREVDIEGGPALLVVGKNERGERNACVIDAFYGTDESKIAAMESFYCAHTVITQALS